MNDLELLQTYEPIIKFTHGELFFPCAVDEYVNMCSLWLRPPNHGSRSQLSEKELTLEKLIEYSKTKPIPPKHTLYLRFVPSPLNGVQYTTWLNRKDRPRFQASGRLARVGLLARFVDALFSLSLVVRGTVPGGTSAAAHIRYQELRQKDPRYVYYGRVKRQNGYIILQYLYFYAMNNWRSGFSGVNDHEADWEQVFVYLEDRGSEPPNPTWVAYASHDYSGDDLRRRWDDPELVREGNHPVIFSGAGSHASYFQQGEYLTNIKIAALEPLWAVLRFAQRIWRVNLQQGDSPVFEQVEALLDIPFVDYARGDGVVIGSGYDTQWTPVLLTDDTEWAEYFRGLWGLDAKDPLAGESAPGGPKYNRDGTLRQSWHDPLGWSGLRKVAPPIQAEKTLRQHIADLKQDLASVERKIKELDRELPQLDIEVRALRTYRHLSDAYVDQEQKRRQMETELSQLVAQQAELQEMIKANNVYLRKLSAGYQDDPQEHILHQHKPQSPDEIRDEKVISFWAAMSSGLLLLITVAVVALRPLHWEWVLGGLLAMFVGIEALLRRQLEQLLLNMVLILAFITSGILLIEYLPEVILGAVTLLAVTATIDNIRELRQHN